MTLLALHEELYLLASGVRGELHEDVEPLRIGCAAAALHDMLLSGHLRIRNRVSRTVVPEGTSAELACSALKRVHRLILASGEERDLAGWLEHVVDRINLPGHAGVSLAAQGLVSRDGRTSRLIDTGTWTALRKRVRAAVVRDERPDERTRALVAIANESGLLGHVMEASVQALYGQRLRALSNGVHVRHGIRSMLAAGFDGDGAIAAAALLWVLTR